MVCLSCGVNRWKDGGFHAFAQLRNYWLISFKKKFFWILLFFFPQRSWHFKITWSCHIFSEKNTCIFQYLLAFWYVVSGYINHILATCSSVIDRNGGAHCSPRSSLSKWDVFKEMWMLLLLVFLNEFYYSMRTPTPSQFPWLLSCH